MGSNPIRGTSKSFNEALALPSFLPPGQRLVFLCLDLILSQIDTPLSQMERQPPAVRGEAAARFFVAKGGGAQTSSK